MMADIFYHIFTLANLVLACVIRNKKLNYSGISHSHLHQGIALDPPGGLTAPPTPRVPAAIVFGFTKNRCAHSFSVFSPDNYGVMK